MRHVLIVDKKIPQSELIAWQSEDAAFWQKFADITPVYWTIEYDFSDYPTFTDGDGDQRPTPAFLTEQVDRVHSSYNDFGTDFVMLLIHEDNWKSDPPGPGGIWGTNFSGVYRNYHVQYCRWDKDNSANTFGTLYHERHHALDALIKIELGFDVSSLFDGIAWDRCITHGGCGGWAYIRHKENTEALVKIAPYLKLALTKRQKRHDEWFDTANSLIKVLATLVYWLRKRLNAKNGVSASL